MTYAYRATAYIGDKSAGHVGTYLRREDYQPYRSSPPVRWTRISIPADVAERMKAGESYAQATAAPRS